MTGASATSKPIIAMRCIVQIPEPMEAAPSASQPGFHALSLRSERIVQRSPSALPRHAITYATTGVTAP